MKSGLFFLSKNVCIMRQSFLQNISNKALTQMANVFYGSPSKDFFVIVITWTNWKTTTWLMLNYLINNTVGKSAFFTPDFTIIWDQKTSKPKSFSPIEINSFLAEAKWSWCQVAIFIFDTINIAKWLLESIEIDMGILTNVKTNDDNEIDTYKHLFNRVISNDKPNKTAILPKDDKIWNKWYNEMVFGKVMNFGIIGSANLKADNIEVWPNKTDFTCNYLWQQYKTSTSVVWQHNINHLLASMSAMMVIWIPIENLLPILDQIPSTLTHIPNNYQKNWVSWYFENSQTPDVIYQTWTYCKSLHQNGNLFVINFLDTKKTTDQLQELIQIDISLGWTTVLWLEDINQQQTFRKLKPVRKELNKEIWDNFFYFNSKNILLNRIYKNSKPWDIVLVVWGKEKENIEIIDKFY